MKPAFLTAGGHRRYTQEQVDLILGKSLSNQKKVNIGYVRVSSKKQSDDLERQYQLMENYLISKGQPYIIIKSIGSGINYQNPNLQELVKHVIKGECNKVYVLHKDRLVRFGFELLQYLFSEFNTEIEVINQQTNSPEKELVTDLIQIITVFSAKLNGKSKYKLNEFREELKENGNNISD